jgi:Zn-dependent peptidase ImmA (M78 family)
MKRNWYAGSALESALDPDERRGLKRFEMLCRHFASLERLVEGEVRFALPTDTAARSSMLEGTAARQGEQLADLERKRLNLGQDPLDDVVSVLDGMGIKVVCVRLPSTSRVSGGFFFDSAVGPCIMVNCSMPPEEQMVAAAHEYCHFVADYNPYLPRLCSCGAPPGDDESEVKAAGFAGAFLLPGGSLEQLFSGNNGVGTDEAAIQALGVYYGVPMWAVAHRLETMGLEVEYFPEDYPASGPDSVDGSLADLPRRMVRLALEARAGGLVTPRRMARLLQMEQARAEGLFAYFTESNERERDSKAQDG